MAAKKEAEAVPETIEEAVPETIEEAVPETIEETVSGSEKVEESPVLKAVSYILYNSRQYAPGQELPTNNLDMVKAWIDAGTAVWMGESSEAVKAVPMTAIGGLSGEAVGPESAPEGDLVGRVPDTEQRKEK